MRALTAILLLSPLPLLAQSVESLPLKPGFYVRVEAACAEASTATLTLHHRRGLRGLRDSCRFDAITRTGPSSYQVTQSCGEDGRDFDTDTVTYDLQGTTRFTLTSPYGWSYTSRLCAQSELPAPYDAVDLPALLEQL